MTRPVSASEFATAMAALGPLETGPAIALGISGGSDSMALLHLSAEWAAGHGATVIAITVDHNLRPESVGEARQVGAWSAALNVEHIVVKWKSAALSSVQSRARQARYDLLSAAAYQRGILHLMVAHHAGDQAETVLLRLSRGSGPDGLAGMSAVHPLAQLQILRPLLSFSRERLQATCDARGQAWIDDPSNISARFARPRLRAARSVLAAEGLTATTLAQTALASGRVRELLDVLTADVAARCVRLLPHGFAEIDVSQWQSQDTELRRRLLSQIVQTIGGGEYRALGGRLNEIVQSNPIRTTLGNCLIEADGPILRVSREQRNLAASRELAPGAWTRWDRFGVLAGIACSVGALGPGLLDDFSSGLPSTVIATQPALRAGGVLLAVPTLGFYNEAAASDRFECRFSPRRMIGETQFAIV